MYIFFIFFFVGYSEIESARVFPFTDFVNLGAIRNKVHQ